MKRVTLFIILLTIIGLSACIDPITKPNFENLRDFTYYIGDNHPNYLENVRVTDLEENDITDQLTFDDSLVDYSKAGTYQVIYKVIIDDQEYTKKVNVIVKEKEIVLDKNFLSLYYLNDLHGAILENEDQMGLAKIANLILTKKAEDPLNTLFIAGGDMLQGTLLSNYFDGASTIDLLNDMKLDSFVIGNHEFDWGIEKVLQYFNGKHEIKANFPLLGANVYLKETNELPEGITPYQVINKGNLKVGIIGVIGYGLESSIATGMVKDYYFNDPIIEVKKYAKILREEEKVDLVVVVNHHASDMFNQEVASLSGSYFVDALFNGHTHQAYVRAEGRNGVYLPVVQSGSSGTNVGYVKLNLENNKVVSYTAENLNYYNSSLLSTENSSIEEKIQFYLDEVRHLYEEPILYAGEEMSKSSLTYYIAKLIGIASDSDIAWHNSGGTRTSINKNQAITVATLYDVFPFDNVIKTAYIKGSEINSFMNTSYGSYYYLKNSYQQFESDTYYKVATNEYVFDYEDNPFIDGIDQENTGIVVRELLIEVMRNQKESGMTHFYLDTPINISNNNEFVLKLMNYSYRTNITANNIKNVFTH